jgi:hypothetical protein
LLLSGFRRDLLRRAEAQLTCKHVKYLVLVAMHV